MTRTKLATIKVDRYDMLRQSWSLLRCAFGVNTDPVHPGTMAQFVAAIASGINKITSEEARIYFANADQRLEAELRKAGHVYEEFFTPNHKEK